MTVWLSAREAAQHATKARHLMSAGAAEVTVTTIYSWERRGHLIHTGLDDDGHRLYDLADVAAAELVTRARALRLVGIGQPEPPHT